MDTQKKVRHQVGVAFVTVCQLVDQPLAHILSDGR
jgi:hypothetical protein